MPALCCDPSESYWGSSRLLDHQMEQLYGKKKENCIMVGLEEVC